MKLVIIKAKNPVVVSETGRLVLKSDTDSYVTNHAYELAQKDAHEVVTLANALTAGIADGSYNFTECKTKTDFNSVAQSVYSKLYAATRTEFVPKPTKPELPKFLQEEKEASAEWAKSFGSFQTDTEEATALNNLMQPYAIIKETETDVVEFQLGVSEKVAKIYTVAEILAAQKVIYTCRK